MAVKSQYLAYVLEQLADLGGVRSRRMFGGVGLYRDDRFFGLIDDQVLYFKVDDSTRADYLARGCEPFRPFKDKPEYSMSYFGVPPDVLEDGEELARWARRSVAIASPPRRPAADAVRRPREPVANARARAQKSTRR
jgi:DNA transformation protein